MNPFKLGLTSVTFRPLSPEEIIRLAAEAKLDGIEWGGDIHVPAGDLAIAEKVGKMTRDAGLKVLSYGSYYHALPDTEAEGKTVLQTAAALGAPNIRIWAGNTDSSKLDDASFESVAASIERFCIAAERHGITVSTEYHANTATSDIETTARLLDRIKNSNFYTYFQPDVRHTDAENLVALKRILPRVSNIHVFYWKSWTERYLLSEGTSVWMPYLKLLAGSPEKSFDHAAIMEFVKDDAVENFRKDAASLHELAETCRLQ